MNDLLFEQDYQERENISVDELDKALLEVRHLEERYDEIHAQSSAAWNAVEAAKQNLISLMDRAGKDRWSCAGAKGYSLRKGPKYRVPKGLEEKRLFFDFLASQTVGNLLKQDPQEVFLAYASIHAGSFNTLCKKLVEEASQLGECIHLPGVEAPTVEKTLVSLRK